jgi:hypothetical protein
MLALNGQGETFARAEIMANAPREGDWPPRPLVYGRRNRAGRWIYCIVASPDAKEHMRGLAPNDRHRTAS